MDAKTVGARLAQLRSGLGLTQGDVADDLDIHQTAISKFELGQRDFTTSRLSKFAAYFGVTVSDLVGSDHIEPGPEAPARRRGAKREATPADVALLLAPLVHSIDALQKSNHADFGEVAKAIRHLASRIDSVESMLAAAASR